MPILATATVPSPELVSRIGAYGFVPKPFELERLLWLMERGRHLSDKSAQLRERSELALERMRQVRGEVTGGES